jgi:hypothetical protein
MTRTICVGTQSSEALSSAAANASRAGSLRSEHRSGRGVADLADPLADGTARRQAPAPVLAAERCHELRTRPGGRMKKSQSRRKLSSAEEARPMITAIVQYKLPPHIDLAACAAHYRDIAPGFRAVPGLISKQFIYSEDGWAGGVYLWQTRAAADAFYHGPWLDGIRERYGMDPQITFFQTACITDNATGVVHLPDAAR